MNFVFGVHILTLPVARVCLYLHRLRSGSIVLRRRLIAVSFF